MVEDEQRARLWRHTWIVAAAAVGVVLVALSALPLFMRPLDAVFLLGFPLGIYLLAQGAIVALVVAGFWFAAYQERVDRRHGAAEDF